MIGRVSGDATNKQLMSYIRRHPHADLNGKCVAYGINGAPLGEAVLKKGMVIVFKQY